MVFITLGKLISVLMIVTFFTCCLSFVIILNKKVNTRELSGSEDFLDLISEVSLATTIFISLIAIILTITEKYFEPIYSAIILANFYEDALVATLVLCLFIISAILGGKAAKLIYLKLAFRAIDMRIKRCDNPFQTFASITYMPFSIKFKKQMLRHLTDKIKKQLKEEKEQE